MEMYREKYFMANVLSHNLFPDLVPTLATKPNLLHSQMLFMPALTQRFVGCKKPSKNTPVVLINLGKMIQPC